MATKKKAKKLVKKTAKIGKKILHVAKQKPAKKKLTGKPAAKKQLPKAAARKAVATKPVARKAVAAKPVALKAVAAKPVAPESVKKAKPAAKSVTALTLVQTQSSAATPAVKTAVSPIAAWPFPTGTRP